MPVSFNAGVSNTADTSAAVTLALPSGILVNDVMLMSLTCFNLVAAAPAIAFSGAGGTWTLVPVTVGANPAVASGGGNYSYGFAYYRVATAGDIGATLTVTGSGAGFDSTNTWWAAAVASYTTASTVRPVDVAGSAASYTAGGVPQFSVACPVMTTVCTADWGVYLGGGGPGIGSVLSGPLLTRPRQNIVSDAGIGAVISDSGGSAGYSIGGGAFTTNNQGTSWLTGFSVGLAPADGGGSGPPFTGYQVG